MLHRNRDRDRCQWVSNHFIGLGLCQCETRPKCCSEAKLPKIYPEPKYFHSIHWVPPTTRHLIHKNALVVSGTLLIQTFWTLMSTRSKMRTIRFSCRLLGGGGGRGCLPCGFCLGGICLGGVCHAAPLWTDRRWVLWQQMMVLILSVCIWRQRSKKNANTDVKCKQGLTDWNSHYVCL